MGIPKASTIAGVSSTATSVIGVMENDVKPLFYKYDKICKLLLKYGDVSFKRVTMDKKDTSVREKRIRRVTPAESSNTKLVCARPGRKKKYSREKRGR